MKPIHTLGEIMAKKRLLTYEEAGREISKVLGEIKRNSEELRKLVAERLEVKHDNRKKEASK